MINEALAYFYMFIFGSLVNYAVLCICSIVSYVVDQARKIRKRQLFKKSKSEFKHNFEVHGPVRRKINQKL